MEPKEGYPNWTDYDPAGNVRQGWPRYSPGATRNSGPIVPDTAFEQHMVQSVAAAKDLAGIHEAVASWQRAKDRMEAERMQWKRERLMQHYGSHERRVTETLRGLGYALADSMNDQQEKDTMTTHNDTLTALHVKQGTKFCAVKYYSGRMDDRKLLTNHRTRAKNGTFGGEGNTYKHAMDLDLGAVVLTPTGPAVVVALDAAPTFGKGIAYKWIVSDLSGDVEQLHETEGNEKQAVEAMAVSAAMSAADKVLEKMGVAITDKAVALLGGTQDDDFEEARGVLASAPKIQQMPRNDDSPAHLPPLDDDFIHGE